MITTFPSAYQKSADFMRGDVRGPGAVYADESGVEERGPLDATTVGAARRAAESRPSFAPLDGRDSCLARFGEGDGVWRSPKCVDVCDRTECERGISYVEVSFGTYSLWARVLWVRQRRDGCGIASHTARLRSVATRHCESTLGRAGVGIDHF